MESDVAYLLRDFYTAHRLCRARLRSLALYLKEAR
jgi:hypothetical protein